MLEKLDAELGRDRRLPHREFACLLLDLNRFKQVNDTLGHPAGDNVLKEMSRNIADCLRTGDSLARLGGDSSWPCCRVRIWLLCRSSAHG